MAMRGLSQPFLVTPAKAGVAGWAHAPVSRGGASLRWRDEKKLDHETRLKRLRYRASHRGTREADLMIGGFFDAHAARWSAEQIAWFEALIDEQDVDIMGWAIGSIPCPPRWDGAMMRELRALSYVPLPG